MTRRAALATVFGVVGMHVPTVGAQAPITLAVGRFGATDQELQEGYFNIGQHAMLVLHPKGEPVQMARELVGRTGRLVFIPD